MSGLNTDKDKMKSMMKNPMLRNMMGDNMDEVEKLLDDDQTVKQMQGFWKQLDDMSLSDKSGYDDFIKK